MAGGRSSRFGADKRLARLDGRTLAERAAETLRAAVQPDGEVMAVGPRAAHLPALGLAWLEDAVPSGVPGGGGPLGPCAGLLAVARAGGGIVLACDMPLVPASTLQVLPHLGGERPAAPLVNGRLMPLSAWWPEAAAPALERCLQEGRGRAADAFWEAGGRALALEELGLGADDAWLFAGVNTPWELNWLQARLEEQGGLWG